MRMHRALLCLTLAAVPALAQAPAADPFAPLAFLEGTWSANASGSGGAAALGTYSWVRELKGHTLARNSTSTGCKGPQDFDCNHTDILYVFQDGPPGAPLHALYLDNEGHSIHYTVSTPTPHSAVFLSEPAPGPQFRLVYELNGPTLAGRFEMRPPGADAWHPYLAWSGTRQ